MSRSGPLVIVEDDRDDRDFLEKVFLDLKVDNERLWFENADEALRHLKTTALSTFMIICDINLPGLNGIDFKKTIDADPYLRKKSIPFLYYSTAATPKTVNEAYAAVSVQGFFKKSSSYEEGKIMFSAIFAYWKLCRHPNT